jgi:hypothetical protein
MGGWVGSRVGLDKVAKKKIPTGDRTPVVQQAFPEFNPFLITWSMQF